MKNIKMNGEWVAIKPAPLKQFAATGVLIPETSQRMDEFHQAEVLAVGPGFDGAPITNLKAGDTIVFQSQLGSWVNKGFPDEHMVVRHSAIVEIGEEA